MLIDYKPCYMLAHEVCHNILISMWLWEIPSSAEWKQFCLGLSVLTHMSNYLFLLWVPSLDPVPIPDKRSYHNISQRNEATRFVFKIVRLLWNLTGTSAAVLPMGLLNFKATQSRIVKTSRDLMRKRLIGYCNGPCIKAVLLLCSMDTS